MPVDEAAVERLTSWEGPLGRAVSRRIERFEATVRANAPFRPGNPGTHLVDTIGNAKYTTPGALIARVGANPHESVRGYALMVHRGTRPHPIAVRRAQSLRFKVAGRIVFATRVSHPGTQPDRFLTRHIRELV